MVKRLFVSGLGAFITEDSLRKYFETFGELYECVIPSPPRYNALDFGPDNEKIEERSDIRYEPVLDSNEVLDEELDVVKYDEKKFKSFEEYIKKIGDGEGFIKKKRKTCAGYAFITFVFMEGFQKCMEKEDHMIEGLDITVQLAKNDEFGVGENKLESKRLFVSYFPLDKLTAKELKTTFGGFGKITDVEFVSDSEGPLHFCILTFTETEAVDQIIKKSHFVRNTRLFVRRAILRESIKIAEQRLREEETRADIERQHGYAGFIPPTAEQIRQSADQFAANSRRFSQDLQPAGGAYRPLVESQNSSKLLEGYGYGDRNW
ncbi:unnamed protein product [Caenorhabditis angaria]|uniref:RRM domain-containing protein n=1 Tax=Caenorhabditis angaria TaxID=860376 RepID=A0A9P1N011_9PELO|nr:unnamed protein product [Caenorhabditis angaria]